MWWAVCTVSFTLLLKIRRNFPEHSTSVTLRNEGGQGWGWSAGAPPGPSPVTAPRGIQRAQMALAVKNINVLQTTHFCQLRMVWQVLARGMVSTGDAMQGFA